MIRGNKRRIIFGKAEDYEKRGRSSRPAWKNAVLRLPVLPDEQSCPSGNFMKRGQDICPAMPWEEAKHVTGEDALRIITRRASCPELLPLEQGKRVSLIRKMKREGLSLCRIRRLTGNRNRGRFPRSAWGRFLVFQRSWNPWARIVA